MASKAREADTREARAQMRRIAAKALRTIDVRDLKQNSEFVPGLEQAQGADLRNTPGNSGPFDASGELIFPIDTRKMH